MKRTIKSFTLIELLVVIVIIGILSGVIVISVTNYINDAKNTKIVAELSNLSKSFEGNSRYYVGSLCIEDSASNSAFKTYYGLTSVPVHPNYDNGTSLTTNNCYLYFSDGDSYSIRTPSVGNKGYLIQESRTQKTKPIEKNCETGWIPFGNRCIMKYEASSDGTTNCKNAAGTAAACPVSNTTTTPWVSINQANAKAACESIGAHLITNAEWMALARDIESVASNYVDVSGTSTLKRGNVGLVDNASYDGANPEYGTGRNELAKLTLSNGEEIWDLSGNVREWMEEMITDGEQYINFNSKASGLYEYNAAGLFDVANKLPYSEVGPKGTYVTPSFSGMGKIQIQTSSGSSTNRAFLRGGSWSHTSNAGAFSLNLYTSLSYINGDAGFRCAR